MMRETKLRILWLKKKARNVIAKAQREKRQKLGEMLEKENKKGNAFKIAKQRKIRM